MSEVEKILGPTTRKGDLPPSTTRAGVRRTLTLEQHLGDGLDPEVYGAKPEKRKKQVNLGPRTTKYLDDHGWTYAKCETYNVYSGRKNDLFGCLDYIALKKGRCMGIQVTTHNNASARVNKSTALPELRAWLNAGNEFQVWGWHKPGTRWELVRRDVRLDELGQWVITVEGR